MVCVFLVSFISYELQVWPFRVLAVIGPVAVYFVVRRVLEELKAREQHPLRRFAGRVLVRSPAQPGHRRVRHRGSGNRRAGAGIAAGDRREGGLPSGS